ncbi:hypothetical protein BDV09DRAFT_196917 [Aspergillus tetrazonus]
MPPQQTYEPNHAEILVKRENELTLLETRAQIIDDRIWELVSAENPRVTEFLWARIMRTETRLAYLRSYADCLEEMKAAGITGHETFIIETQAVARTTRKRAQELRLLTRHGPAIIGEMEMEIERLKTRPLELVNNSEIRTTLLGCAYGNVLERLKVTNDLERINDPQVSNERKLLFQKAVSEYYNAVSISGDYVWCHVLGRWVVSRKATAAQFVPGSVSREDLAYLFGEEGLNTCDARNGLTVAPAIKLLLYKGIITFAPSPGTATAFTRWQCILLDDSQGNDVVWVGPPPEQRGAYPEVIHLKDIDGKDLSFMSDKRPSPAFIYFHFLISCMYAKVQRPQGNVAMAMMPGSWPLVGRGRYLERKTLSKLTRCLTGCVLPQWLLDGKTFVANPNDKDPDYCARSRVAAMILAADLGDIWSQRIKEAHQELLQGCESEW